ncbi:MAG: XRE family transcriptional regulator [Clostridiales bacterium]|nr:XRE family transcriptional regulator [Clostridiales bacterium]
MYYLKQYDTILLQFDILEDPLEGQSCRLISVCEDNRYLLPTGLQLSDSGMMSWLRTRVIPKNREFVDAFLAKNGLAHSDVKGIIDICLGLSLNDSYWVVPADFDGVFADYNLYENDFIKALSLIAYTGYGTSRVRGFTSSPEFTTAGMLRKGWRRLGGKTLLFKGGTSGAANTGNEPYSEFYASQIAERMGVDCVHYDLAMWKKSLCSTCELFSDIDHSYVPMYRFVEEPTVRGVAKYLKGLGEDFYDRYVDMLIFDAVICNEDRHYGNFGLMVDNKTNKPYAFAPVFDNGLSLFNYAMPDDLVDISAYAKTRQSHSGASFDNIVREFITDRQRKMLRKLIGFRFTDHPSYKWSAKRKSVIEKYIQERVNELLGENLR